MPAAKRKRKRPSKLTYVDDERVMKVRKVHMRKEDAENLVAEKCVVHALDTVTGPAKNWKGLKERGLTDIELQEYIGSVLGIQGGFLGRALHFDYKGGPNPCVRAYKKGSWKEYADIKGARLVGMVRRLFKIPYPGEA